MQDTNVVFKRKFRWTLEAKDKDGTEILKPTWVKVNSRPTLNIEETEVNFLSTKTWIPGKSEWQDITFTFYDGNTEELAPFWKHLSSYFFNSEVPTGTPPPEDAYCEFTLKLYDGCGSLVETWEIQEAYASSINFGELDHSSSEICTIEMTVKYKKVKYTSNVPVYIPTPVTPPPAPKVSCPSCKHEFEAPTPPPRRPMGIGLLGNSNIIY